MLLEVVLLKVGWMDKSTMKVKMTMVMMVWVDGALLEVTVMAEALRVRTML